MKIAFVHKGLRSFVKKDLEILQNHFSVQQIEYDPRKGIWNNLKQQFRLFWHSIVLIPFVDLIYIWFAGYHSFLPVLIGKLFRKKIVVALGGYETTYIPEIQYGVFSNPLRSFCARFTFNQADLLLPVDETLIFNLKQFMPRFNTPYTVLDFGYDGQFWYRTRPKKGIVLTVATLNSEIVFKRKGIDLFVEACKQLPEFQFHVVGVEAAVHHLFPELPNLILSPGANPEQLREYYSEAKVYAQFSMYEGFPNVVCEGMLCECIPVVAAVNGMPRQVGDCGIVLKERSVQEAVRAIRYAMNLPEARGKQCRERVIKHFPVDKRETLLIKLIEEIKKG